MARSVIHIPTDDEIREKAHLYGERIYWFYLAPEEVQAEVEKAFFDGAKAMLNKFIAESLVVLPPEKEIKDGVNETSPA